MWVSLEDSQLAVLGSTENHLLTVHLLDQQTSHIQLVLVQLLDQDSVF